MLATYILLVLTHNRGQISENAFGSLFWCQWNFLDLTGNVCTCITIGIFCTCSNLILWRQHPFCSGFDCCVLVSVLQAGSPFHGNWTLAFWLLLIWSYFNLDSKTVLRTRTHEVMEDKLLLEGSSYLQTAVFECKSENLTCCSCFTEKTQIPKPTISICFKDIIWIWKDWPKTAQHFLLKDFPLTCFKHVT